LPISPPSSSGPYPDDTPTPPPPSAPIQPALRTPCEPVPIASDAAAMFPRDMSSIQQSAMSIPHSNRQTRGFAMGSSSLSMDAYQYPLTTTANTTSFCVPSSSPTFPTYPYNELPPHFEVQVTAQHMSNLQQHAPLSPQLPIQGDTTPCDVARDLIHGFRTAPEDRADLENRLCPQGANNSCVIDNQMLFGLLNDI